MQNVTLKSLIAATPEDHKEEAEHIFGSVFDSLMWSRIIDGIVEDNSPSKEWRHRKTEEIESDISCLEIYRADVLDALSDYLEKPIIKSKEADWLFLNLLVYAEYIATVKELRIKAVGVINYIKNPPHTTTEHSTDIAKYFHKWWHTPLALGVIFFGWIINPLIAIAFAVYIIYEVFQQRKKLKKSTQFCSACFKHIIPSIQPT